jgi:glycosyltransferase involved in cell wall biosynthesis
VGFLISGCLDTLTGGYIYDRRLVDYLRQKGHQVDVLPLPCRSYLDRLLYSPQSLFSRQLDHLSADVLLEDELDHAALILLNQRLKRQAKFPIISIVHNLHCCEIRAKWQNQLFQSVEKNYLNSVDGFIFNSHTTLQTVENLIGMSKYSVVANPCGDRLPGRITELEIKERAGKRGSLRILFLGNLFRNKGLHVLLDAMGMLPYNTCFLTVAGDLTVDRPYVKSIKNQVGRLNLHNNVSFTGPLNGDDLVQKLKESHILAVPSFYEGYGMAYLEGMGFGLPSIATTSGAAGEIITDGRDGFLISPGDSVTLSQYLRMLSQERDRLLTMSLNAFRRFNSHPTWQITCEKILNFLQSRCSTSSP